MEDGGIKLNVNTYVGLEIFFSKPTLSLQSLESLSSIQLLIHVQFFATPRTAAHQTSLPITNSRSLLKLMSVQLVMPSNYLILCHPLLLPPSIFPSIRVFSNESVVCIRWPKYWSFSFSISPSNEYSGLISFRMDWLDLLPVQGTLKSLLSLVKLLGIEKMFSFCLNSINSCVFMLSCFNHVQLFVALWTTAPHAPLSMGFSRQERWSGLTCPPPGDPPNPGIKPMPLISTGISRRFFTTSTTWEVP